MCRSPPAPEPSTGRRRSRCFPLIAVAALLARAWMPAPAAAADMLALEVVINGFPTGKIGEFQMDNGVLMARPQELRDIGLRVPEGIATDAEGLVALSALPAVSFRFDQPTQTVLFTTGIDQMEPTKVQVGPEHAPLEMTESGLGLTLNYDGNATFLASHSIGNIALDGRLFTPWGVASSTMAAYIGSSPAGTGTSAALRLDSAFVVSEPDSLRRYRLGDFISGGLGWTRSVRLGGAQIMSDFSMRPDLVTFPLPVLAGAVAVPSTLDLLVNGTHLLSRAMPAGPFEIPQLPIVAGSGKISMIITDALGRQITTSLPYFASQNMLAEGLESYAIEAGEVRHNWGMMNDFYGRAAASATYRRGVTPWLTIEGHAETAGRLVMAGGGMMVNLFNFGVLSASAAHSSTSGASGRLYAAGFQHVGDWVNFGASATITSHDFTDIASGSGDPAPRARISASAGLNLGRFGTVGIAYSAVDRDRVAAPLRFFTPYAGALVGEPLNTPGGSFSTAGNILSFQPSQHVHVATASYSAQYNDITFYATGYRDLARGGSTGILIGLAAPLGRHVSANTSMGFGTGTPYQMAQVAQTPEVVGDWGYHVTAASTRPTHLGAELQYKSPWASIAAGADRFDRQSFGHLEVRGALSLLGGGVFASNTIDDSFAVVDTGGVGGIRVLHENKEVGRTDADGLLLVPDLHSFDLNRLAIDPTDVAADSDLDYASRIVRPPDRAGVVVRFPMRRSNGALVKLVMPDGKPVALGSIVQLLPSGATAPVGYDGDTYLQGLAPDNNVRVTLPNGQQCTSSFTFTPAPGDIPSIGPVTCRRE